MFLLNSGMMSTAEHSYTQMCYVDLQSYTLLMDLCALYQFP